MAERRSLSVLSCLLSESDRLFQHLDAEDYYDLMQAFHVTCVERVAPYAGHVGQPSDAGLLVYFGYPQAHDDAAQRAVHSGLAIAEAVRHGALDAWALPGRSQAVRVGIATGMMIVSADSALAVAPALGVGSASSRAPRLAALAPPGGVVISEATMRMVSGYFECKALEDVRLADTASPEVYEVRGVSSLQTRLEVESAHGLTPFVGREAEVALFADRWTSVREGLGQVVWVQGEAGMGKSRLVQVVKEWLAGDWTMAWECRCSPYHQNTALYPVIDLMQRALQVASESSPAQRLARLEALLAPYELALDETVPLLADLLSLPLPQGRYAPLTLAPPQQRERTLETLVSLLLRQAAESPLWLVIEDVHWADPSTLELLQLLLAHVGAVSLLVVMTSRPGFEAPWGPRSELTPVVLSRLSWERTAQMIAQVAGGKGLPAEVLAQLVEKTDGSPLFIEELTRMVLESGHLVERGGQYKLRGALHELTIPVTLQDSLTARLDRLGGAKELVQWGSVLGREFSHELLVAVRPDDEEELQSGLAHLVASGLVFQRGLLPQARYRFKHALVQDAAYQSLRRHTRRAYHQRIAQVLSDQFPEAGETDTAVRYWQRAGQRALERSANPEAIAHVRQGLALLVTQPETRVRWQQELDLQVALGSALIVTQGNAAPEVERVYTRARELCQQVGDTPQLFPVLRGLIVYYQTRGQLQIAFQLAEQLLRLAQSQPEPVFLMLAHYI
jgi:predicted ATPase/class 3 adenylate cyclase